MFKNRFLDWLEYEPGGTRLTLMLLTCAIANLAYVVALTVLLTATGLGSGQSAEQPNPTLQEAIGLLLNDALVVSILMAPIFYMIRNHERDDTFYNRCLMWSLSITVLFCLLVSRRFSGVVVFGPGLMMSYALFIKCGGLQERFGKALLSVIVFRLLYFCGCFAIVTIFS